MFLTNLRPAIESLTDAELKDLQVDFEPLAAQIPADVQHEYPKIVICGLGWLGRPTYHQL